MENDSNISPHCLMLPLRSVSLSFVFRIYGIFHSKQFNSWGFPAISALCQFKKTICSFYLPSSDSKAFLSWFHIFLSARVLLPKYIFVIFIRYFTVFQQIHSADIRRIYYIALAVCNSMSVHEKCMDCVRKSSPSFIVRSPSPFSVKYTFNTHTMRSRFTFIIVALENSKLENFSCSLSHQVSGIFARKMWCFPLCACVKSVYV